MKFQARVAATFIICAIVFCGCTVSGTPSGNSQPSQAIDSEAGVSHSESAAATSPDSETASQPDSTSFTTLQDITIDAQDGKSYVFTVEQQAIIAKQVEDAVKKYQSGEYPIEPGEATDYAPFAQPWPNEVPYPESISPSDIIFAKGLQRSLFDVNMPMSDEYTMIITVVQNEAIDKSDPNYWYVDSIGLYKV